MCVLSGVIFALCYFRVAHIYILVDFLLVGLDIAYIIAIGKFLIRNHPRENSLLCVLSGVIFALCYFRVAHIYILVDFLLVGLDIAYIIAIGKFLPKGIANQVIHNRLSFLLVRPMIKFSDLLFDFYQ